MRKTKIFTLLISLVMLCVHAAGCVIDDSPPKLQFAEAAQVELLVFRCGDVYLTHEKDNLEWLPAYGDIPAELSLQDGEFAYVNADISRVTGGSSFYNGNPEFTTVNSIEEISFEELTENGELTAYDTEETFRGLGYYDSETEIYCIAQHLGTYYVYEDSTCTGVYHTKDDLVSALGIS